MISLLCYSTLVTDSSFASVSYWCSFFSTSWATGSTECAYWVCSLLSGILAEVGSRIGKWFYSVPWWGYILLAGSWISVLVFSVLECKSLDSSFFTLLISIYCLCTSTSRASSLWGTRIYTGCDFSTYTSFYCYTLSTSIYDTLTA